MPYIAATSFSDSDALPAQPHALTYKRIVRTCICAVLFGVPLCLAAPTSPLLKMSQTQDNAMKTVVPRIMSDFFSVNFIASAAAYLLLIEPRIENPLALDGFLPYLGPLSAQVPGFTCLFVSHLFYPGMWAIVNERTWTMRRREFVRLNTKCFFAFAPLHVPGAIATSLCIGTLLYPFKFVKDKSWKKSLEQQKKLKEEKEEKSVENLLK